MKILAIYDNGGKTADRYTVVTDQAGADNYLMMLSFSDGGEHVSMWGDGIYRPKGNNNILGRRIHFEDLSAKNQSHVALRVFL